MAQRVASLYAEIGADTSGLEKGLARASDGLESTAKGATTNKMRFTELASAANLAGQAYQIVSGAAKQAYQVVSEGAQLELAQSRFDNLSASIGTTSAALNDELSDATNGMMSNAKQMAAASQIISLGLADTQEEVVDLATLTSKLGWDMQQVIMTFANDSVMRLDALGLSVEDVKEKQKALEQQGYATSEAFDMAVIEAGKEKLILLGDASETTAGQLAMVEANLANVTDEMKRQAAQSAGPLIASIASGMSAQKTWNEAIAKGIITQSEYNKLAARTWNINDKTGQAYIEITAELEAYDAEVQNASYALDGFTQSQDSARMSMTDTTAALGDYSTLSTYARAGIAQGRLEVSRYVVSLREQEAATEAAAEATRLAAEAASIQSEAYHLMSSAMSEAADPLRDYFQAQTDIVDSQGEWVEAFTDNSSQIGEISAALAMDLSDEQKKAWSEILATSAEGGAEWLSAYSALQGDLTQAQRNELIARQNELQGASGQAISVYTGDSAAYEAAQQAKIEANQAVITSLKEVALATIEGQVTAAVASGELSAAAGNAFLVGVGEGLGLLSEAEADAQLAVGNASLEMADQLNQSLQYVIETGGATAQEIGVMSGEVTASIAENWENLQDESEDALVETGKIKDMVIDGIPDDKYVTIHIRTEGSIPDLGGGSTGGVGGASGDVGGYGEYATGGVVPGPIGMPQIAVVHGGEEILTPAQRATSGGGSSNQQTVNNINIYNQTREAAALAMAQVYQTKRSRLDAYMGVS